MRKIITEIFKIGEFSSRVNRIKLKVIIVEDVAEEIIQTYKKMVIGRTVKTQEGQNKKF